MAGKIGRIAGAALPIVGLLGTGGLGSTAFWRAAGILGLGAFASSRQSVEGQKLENLGVQLAQEGAEFTRGWGSWRQSGVLVYCPGIDEDKETSSAGGKGGPKITDYKAYGTWLVVGGRGPLTRLNRIRLNETVAYDWNNGNERGYEFQEQVGTWSLDWEPPDTPEWQWRGGLAKYLKSSKGPKIRFYPGSYSQPVDSYLEAKKGVGAWTSYPGLWGVFIEGKVLKEFGNTLPNVGLEPFNAVTSLDAILTEICGWRGLMSDQLDWSQLEGISVAQRDGEGYMLGSRRSAASAIEELGFLHNFTVRECNGVLEAILRGRVSVAVLRGRDFRAHADTEPTTPLEERTGDGNELPLVGDVTFSDPGRENNAGMRTARVAGVRDDSAPGARGGRRDSTTVTASIFGGRALRAAKIALYEKWARSQAFPITLSPAWMRLAAGDPITLSTENGDLEVYLPQITQPFFGALSSTAPLQDRLLYNLPTPADGGEWDSPIPDGDLTPAGGIIDAVALSDTAPDMISKAGVLVWASQLAGRTWNGATAILEVERFDSTGTPWYEVTDIDLPIRATAGFFTADWTPTPPEAGYVNDNPASVEMYHGELHDAVVSDVRRGYNVAITQDGLVFSFTTAEDGGTGIAGGELYTVDGIKAGRWGSDYPEAGIPAPVVVGSGPQAARVGQTIAAGTRFVVLVDEEGNQSAGVKFVTLNSKYTGRQARVRIQPNDVDSPWENETTSTLTAWRARNIETPSPAAVQVSRPSGGLSLSGRSRTRYVDDDAWRSSSSGRLSEKPTSSGFKFEVILTCGAASRALTMYSTDPNALFNFAWTSAQLASALGITEVIVLASTVGGSVAAWGDLGFGRKTFFNAPI